MHDTLQALLALQDIDRKIFRVERELGRLPEELASRQEAFDGLGVALAEKRSALHQLRMQLKEVEDITSGQRQRVRKLEAESHKVGVDAAMLAHYEHEIRGVKRTINQAEDDGLRMIEHIEALEAEVEEGTRQLEQEQRVFATFRENLAREKAAAEDLLARLKEEREAATSVAIPAEQMNIYRGLLRAREGEALAELDGQICQGCYVEIPKNLVVRLMRGTELIQCPSCDRLLYVP